MTWKSHRILTASTIFVLTDNYIFAIIAAIGSVFPDSVEYKLYTEQQWSKNHRTISHWFVVYVVIVLAIYLLMHDKNIFIRNFQSITYLFHRYTLEYFCLIAFLNFIFWFCIGCLLHILEDSVCGSIPFLSPNRKIKLPRLFYVGSPNEYIISFGLSLLFIIWKLANNL